MDSAVFFPLFNGTHLILTTICSVIIFKERLTKKQWVGMVVGLLAIIFLCNPF